MGLLVVFYSLTVSLIAFADFCTNNIPTNATNGTITATYGTAYMATMNTYMS